MLQDYVEMWQALIDDEEDPDDGSMQNAIEAASDEAHRRAAADEAHLHANFLFRCMEKRKPFHGYAEKWEVLAAESEAEADAASQGQTALHIASSAGHVEVCRVLLQHSRFTALDVLDSAGNSALELAKCAGHREVCRLLESAHCLAAADGQQSSSSVELKVLADLEAALEPTAALRGRVLSHPQSAALAVPCRQRVWAVLQLAGRGQQRRQLQALCRLLVV
eukprot:gnl/TRDRNA2_/TRDRNA2_161578_c0_seq4.p1 gnl/TRDRNA2_/TRDRNA2_161578_c0~~gnl/TRDRNA2_/TRDRNA2_161578_c0_seq4.p1  ORF type:complete len:222 (+),score=49.73 gnl/TRDRNA2_/TRDRNA2_161578_c0_seq4:164-829(+)